MGQTRNSRLFQAGLPADRLEGEIDRLFALFEPWRFPGLLELLTQAPFSLFFFGRAPPPGPQTTHLPHLPPARFKLGITLLMTLQPLVHSCLLQHAIARRDGNKRAEGKLQARTEILQRGRRPSSILAAAETCPPCTSSSGQQLTGACSTRTPCC